MPRYVAFLRGVSPDNLKMADLKQCFKRAGFKNVRTVLSSGNVVFDAAATTSERALQSRIEEAMSGSLGRTFLTMVRKVDFLQTLLATDPYTFYAVGSEAKRVVTFLRVAEEPRVSLPLEMNGARVLCRIDREVFTVYVPVANKPVFMTLIEKAFGTEVTTRTWNTVAKCAAA